MIRKLILSLACIFAVSVCIQTTSAQEFNERDAKKYGVKLGDDAGKTAKETKFDINGNQGGSGEDGTFIPGPCGKIIPPPCGKILPPPCGKIDCPPPCKKARHFKRFR